MALSILHWEERPQPDDKLLARFEVGNQKERANISKLMALGIQIVDHQSSFDLRDKSGRLILSGHIDGNLYFEGKRYPVDHKTVFPLVYARINTLEDLLRHKYMYRYVNQITAYQYLNNIDVGVLWLDNLLGDWKFIEVPFDYELMEKILQNCEAAVDSVERIRKGEPEEKALPGYYSDPSVCVNCWAFKRVCSPPFSFGEGARVMENPEFAAMIERRAELDKAATEYDALDKQIKNVLKESGIKPGVNLIVGDYLITAKETHRKEYTAKATTYTSYKIDSMNGKAEAES